MEKSEKVSILSSIVLVGFLVGVIYHYTLGAYLNLGVPFNSFLFPAFGAFSDFLAPFMYLKDFAPYKTVNMWIVYFPLTYVLLFPFMFIKNKIIAYLIFISGFLAYFLIANTKAFTCKNLTKTQNFQNLFILSTMLYPVLYVLDKGNFDMYLFVILALFTYAFKAEKYTLSAILLAIGNSIKPFSILFLLLFLCKKKYKEFFISLILTILLIVGGFMVFKDTFFSQIIIFIKNLAFYQNSFIYDLKNNLGMGFGSSLFMPLKLIFCKLTATPIIPITLLVNIYNIFCLITTVITMFFVWKEKSLWKQLTLLMCNFLLLHSLTFDYKLIFLLIPTWLFVNNKEKSKFDLIYVILFGLLFIPKNIIIVNHIISPTAAQWFSLSIVLNPLLMILLGGLIIYEQFIVAAKIK